MERDFREAIFGLWGEENGKEFEAALGQCDEEEGTGDVS